MNTVLIAATAALVFVGISHSDGAAQSVTPRAVIDGVVADTNLAPIADAEASIAGSSLRVVTTANGRFQIVGLPPGEYSLGLQRRGYIASSIMVQLAPGDTARLSLTLVPAPTVSDTLVVSSPQVMVRRATFQAHRARGRGQFITETEIAQKKAASIRELLRTLSYIRIQGSFVSSARATTFRDACAFQLFVDGTPLKSTNLDAPPAPPDLLGIEVYASVDAIPLEYQAFRVTIAGRFSRGRGRAPDASCDPPANAVVIPSGGKDSTLQRV